VKRLSLLVVACAALLILSTGAALAVSDGNYDYRKQHCTGRADNYTTPNRVEPGCRNLTVVVSDTSNKEWVSAGTQQTADGKPVDPSSFTVTQGPGGDPAKGVRLYFGADDNLDNGEHDSSPQVNNGPSDGGAIKVDVDPATVAVWLAALSRGDASYLATHPVPLVSAGTGACADGICFAAATSRRVAFKGHGKGHRSVADYEGKQWDPESCGGPSDQPKDCGGHSLKWWNNKEGTVYVDPGVQVYEDPDAQGSPIGPYPLPAAYVGTCGVILGGGAAPAAPASPITNRAGQIDVPTAC
jgi:hypothetical protein